MMQKLCNIQTVDDAAAFKVGLLGFQSCYRGTRRGLRTFSSL